MRDWRSGTLFRLVHADDAQRARQLSFTRRAVGGAAGRSAGPGAVHRWGLRGGRPRRHGGQLGARGRTARRGARLLLPQTGPPRTRRRVRTPGGARRA